MEAADLASYFLYRPNHGGHVEIYNLSFPLIVGAIYIPPFYKTAICLLTNYSRFKILGMDVSHVTSSWHNQSVDTVTDIWTYENHTNITEMGSEVCTTFVITL